MKRRKFGFEIAQSSTKNSLSLEQEKMEPQCSGILKKSSNDFRHFQGRLAESRNYKLLLKSG